MQYEHKAIEERWQRKWKENKTYKVLNDTSKPKYYVLDMFPYPSGAGLHVGHPLGYIASDIVARFKRHQGFNVLHPMGYDSFGLPAEQYAIQTGQHPAKTTEENTARYRVQLDRIGFSFDWDRQVFTSYPAYYKWTQWIFIQLFESWYDHQQQQARPITELVARFAQQGWTPGDACALTGDVEEELGAFTAAEWAAFDERTQQRILQDFRLAYLSEAWVNWCPALGTVLANDEVKDGVSERGGHPVERKRMPQWSMRITAYAQRLRDDLDQLDWSESIKEAQRNWIGRSEGALVRFKLKDAAGNIEVFTTRPDTLFGVTFVTLAPEHELVDVITPAERKAEVDAYVTTAKNRSERDRQADVKRVSGVFTGAYCIHPFTGQEVPIWVGDYVLGGYGTGAVMAVPGGDQRDWNFATHFGLPIIAVTEGADIAKEADERKDATICSEGFLKGLKVPDAITRAIDELVKLGAGERRINYRLRDAAFGRQRYWGEPIPIYYKDGVPYALPEERLPLELPQVDKFLPTETGEPPLARATDWYYTPSLSSRAKSREDSPEPGLDFARPDMRAPKEAVSSSEVENHNVGGSSAVSSSEVESYPLETTTMPGWAGSSWYFLRYMDPSNTERFASEEAVNYWGQVDLYVGGSEHATGHLLYFRFWTKFLYDRGWIPFHEPAKKLVNQGMIQGVSAWVDFITATEGEGLETLPVTYVSWKRGIDMHASKNFSPLEEALAPFNSGKNFAIRGYSTGAFRARVDMVTEPDTLDTAVFAAWRKDSFGDGEIAFVAEADGTFRVRREVEKMSKSKWNVVNPDEIIERYGADTLRLYEMFLGPIEQSKPWDTKGIEGTYRFLRKFWNLFHQGGENGRGGEQGENAGAPARSGPDAPVASTYKVDPGLVSDDAPTKAELKVLHATLKKVTEDIEKLSFNTSVAQFMIAANELAALKCTKRAVLEPLVIALAPFAPHIAEELWEKLGHTTSVTLAPWPHWDAQYLVEDNFSYPISFNGKTRLQLEFPIALDAKSVEEAVLANPEVQQRLEGKAPKKVIVVPKRIVNIVI